MPGHIVHLIGFPGVGKLTIAREIVRQRADIALVDNHLINNPIFSVVNADGKSKLPSEVWHQIFKIRAIVFDTMARLSPPLLDFVLTNFLIDEEEDKAECRKIEDIAEQRGGLYFPVILTCDVEENRRRIVSPERGPNLKAIDPNELDRIRKGPPLLRCDGHRNRIEMDVTHVRPADAASMILQEIDRDRTRLGSPGAGSIQP